MRSAAGLLLSAALLLAPGMSAQRAGGSLQAGTRFGNTYDVSSFPQGVSFEYIVPSFKFHDGEVMQNLRLHFVTLGKPHTGADGHVDNAVLLLHDTSGSAAEFLAPSFAGVLLGPGQLLDPARFYVIIPDAIGHGDSGRPSDGLRMHFPRYDYEDMVRAQYLLLTQGLHVDHARLILGTSMGCMHTYLWGELYPSFMQALMPLACEPVEIGGRNRITRKMILDAIQDDPAFAGGDYKQEPTVGLQSALAIGFVMVSSALQLQEHYPTRDDADRDLDDYLRSALPHTDADDLYYQTDSSRNYNPYPQLGSIQARLLQVNSADDFINPPELQIPNQDMHLVQHGEFVLLPISGETIGHKTYTRPIVWKSYLQQLLTESAAR